MDKCNMLGISLLNLNISDNISGGLFDFNLTLFFIIFQFLLLMLILNSILYKPILTIINKRNKYINDIFEKISNINFKTEQLSILYEQKLKIVQQKVQLDLELTKKIQKEILKIKLNICQKNFDKLLDTIVNDLLKKKSITLKKLDPIIQMLSHEIENKLLI